jgi:hypothetical protein
MPEARNFLLIFSWFSQRLWNNVCSYRTEWSNGRGKINWKEYERNQSWIRGSSEFAGGSRRIYKTSQTGREVIQNNFEHVTPTKQVGRIFAWVNLSDPRSEADHLQSHNFDIKNEWNYTSTPPYAYGRCFFKHRDSIPLYLPCHTPSFLHFLSFFHCLPAFSTYFFIFSFSCLLSFKSNNCNN